MFKLKKTIRRAVVGYRELTAQYRVLPSCLIIGAQKAGTTSLHEYMSQHPSLSPGSKKEVHYFDGGLDPAIDSFAKGSNWYRSHFPMTRFTSSGMVHFEASPLYLFNPLAAARAHELLPQAKLIVVLRDPTDRAISQYFHECRYGYEKRSLEDALDLESSRLAEPVSSGNFKSVDYIHASYRSRGRYHEQLARWSLYFVAEQMLVICSESLFRDPRDTMRDVFGFLGVDQDPEGINYSPRNVGRNKLNVRNETRAELDTYFTRPNQELFDAIGKKFPWGKEPA